MQFMKKYINLNLFFVMSLFLYSLPVMSAEFSFREFEEVSQEVVQTTEGFSKIVFENPVLVITPLTACLLGGVMFKNRHRFPTVQSVGERINRVHGEIELKTIDSLLKFQNACADGMDSCIDIIPLPGLVQEGAKSGWRYMLNGIINLLPLNKKFLAVSFCFWGAGGIMPFSNVFAGFTLLAGFANGLRQDLKKHFDAKIDESTSAINGKIDESTKEIRKDIEGVNGKVALLFMQNAATLVEIASIKAGVRGVQGSLDETRKEILDQVHREGAAVADNVTSNVNTHVDKKLVELFAQISGLTKQCVDLSNGVSKVGHGNTVVAEAMKELENKLLKMREDFSSVLAESVAKMDASTQESAKMLKKIESMGEAQDAKIASLIIEITNNNLLLDSLSKIQSESGQALTTLQENSATHSDLLQKLFTRQDESDLLFSKKISLLQKQNETFETSLNASLDILSQRLRVLEDNQMEMKDLVIQTNLEVKLNAKNQKRQFQVNQALFQQQTQENQILHQEISELKNIAAQQTIRIKTLEDLLGKLLKKSSKVEQDIEEIRKNSEEQIDHLRAMRYQPESQYRSLQQEEQAAVDRGWAIPVNKRLSHSQLPFDLAKPKTSQRKPAQSVFSALTYDPTRS